MIRTHISSLIGITLFSLSCGVSRDFAHTESLETVVPTRVAAALTVVAAPSNDDDRVIAVSEFLAEQCTGLTQGEVDELAAVIVAETDRNELDLRLVLSLMYVESRYHTFAVSPVGAMGLMQVLPATGEEVARRLGIDWQGPETLFDPVINVRIGVDYMKHLTRRYGSNDTALAAYNWGPGNIDKFLRRGAPVPTVYPGLIRNVYAGPIIPVRS